MRQILHSAALLLIAAAMLTGCKSEPQVAVAGTNGRSSPPSDTVAAEVTLPSGSSIEVVLAHPLNSRTAVVGTTWRGSTRTACSVDGREVIPARSAVSGTVTGVMAARKSDRAMLELELSTISVGERNYHVNGTTESIVAGSTRARNLAATRGSTVPSAGTGQAAAGANESSIIAGRPGGGTPTRTVFKTTGYQVELKSGTELTFTTREAVAVRL